MVPFSGSLQVRMLQNSSVFDLYVILDFQLQLNCFHQKFEVLPLESSSVFHFYWVSLLLNPSWIS